MQRGILAQSFKFVFVELIGSILYSPVWWYSKGLKKAFQRMGSRIAYGYNFFGIAVWLKNFFRPMYGVKDIEGRLISVFIRFFMLIFKLLGLFFWMIWTVLAFLAWILLPLFILWQIIFNLNIF